MKFGTAQSKGATLGSNGPEHNIPGQDRFPPDSVGAREVDNAFAGGQTLGAAGGQLTVISVEGAGTSLSKAATLEF
jgi:hypothetical protein